MGFMGNAYENQSGCVTVNHELTINIIVCESGRRERALPICFGGCVREWTDLNKTYVFFFFVLVQRFVCWHSSQYTLLKSNEVSCCRIHCRVRGIRKMASPIAKVIRMVSDLETKIIGEGDACQKT